MTIADVGRRQRKSKVSTLIVLATLLLVVIITAVLNVFIILRHKSRQTGSVQPFRHSKDAPKDSATTTREQYDIAKDDKNIRIRDSEDGVHESDNSLAKAHEAKEMAEAEASLRVRRCSAEDLSHVRTDLPRSRSCGGKSDKHMFMQKCSITVATKCPDPSWLNEYYDTMTQQDQKEPFLAINVGCNKGFDALRLLRLGSRNEQVTTSTWKNAMQQSSDSAIRPGVCGQDSGEDDVPVGGKTTSTLRDATVHCLEPMPLTVPVLRGARNISGYDDIVISQVAASSSSGSTWFPAAQLHPGDAAHHQVKVGTENVGIDNCNGLSEEERKSKCEEVPLMTLDEYAEKHISPSSSRVNVLLTDVEGYDFEVLLGASVLLDRIEYLEFEYNWIGAWGARGSNSTMRSAVRYLAKHGFVCYWAGEKKLWRISKCWLKLYKFKFWSNVACVNEQLAPKRFVDIMERTFNDTIYRDRSLEKNDNKEEEIEKGDKEE